MMISIQRCQHTLIACGLLLLSGCAGFSANTTPTTNQELSVFSPNIRLNQWKITGKMGIRSDQQASSALINWHQCNDRYHIRISGPLGTGAAYLYGDDSMATLETPTEKLTAANAQQLLAQTGWPIPVHELSFWLRGLALPDQPATPLTEIDVPGFKQSGWSLQFNKTLTANHGDKAYTLPAKAIAESNNIKVTLLLRSWDLNPSCELPNE
jgi:outer membrane lipoprotein LolB